MNMTLAEKFAIDTMEKVLLNQYKDMEIEQSPERLNILKAEKDAMIATLSVVGYMVTCDVDTDLKIEAVHVRKI